jgi:hypothetical protein
MNLPLTWSKRFFVPFTRRRHRIYMWKQGRRAGISWDPM